MKRTASIGLSLALAVVGTMALPLPGAAVCGGGGVSALPVPVAVPLHQYHAGLQAPTRLAVDAAGNVYITDPEKAQVLVRAPSGRILSRGESLGNPVSIAVTAGGQLLVGDGVTGSVTAYSAAWQLQFVLGQGAGEFLFPSDIAIDAASGNVYVTDAAAHLVKIYDSSGAPVSSFGGLGSGDGQLNYPTGIFVDSAAGEVYVGDQRNYRVQIFDLTGTPLFCFGQQGRAAGQFNMIQGLWKDAGGRIYVADSFEGRVQILDRNGDFISFLSDFGPGRGKLRVPMDLVIDPSNRLFVTAANNARVEIFGVDAYSDPETFAPATARTNPRTLDRNDPQPVVTVDVEILGYNPNLIVTSSIRVNGVAPNPTPITIGDHDGDGEADLRVEVDWAAFLATVPDGAAPVLVTGTVAGLDFEAADTVTVETSLCGPAAPPCSLGGADPQCNEMRCVEGVGCTVTVLGDGTACETGDACTVDACAAGACVVVRPRNCDDGNLCTDDTCDSASGCVYANNTLPCSDADACTTNDTCTAGACLGGPPPNCDDGNVCTNEDGCDVITGCLHSFNTGPCDDADVCTVGDTCNAGLCAAGSPLACDDLVGCTDDHCDSVLGCLYTPNAAHCGDGNVCTDDVCDAAAGCVYPGNTLACDDANPGTILDACDGAGVCAGQPAPVPYALLRWPDTPADPVRATLRRRVAVNGPVCADALVLRSDAAVIGDLVAAEPIRRAMTFSTGSAVDGNLITGGGWIAGLSNVALTGGVDTSGSAPQLGACAAAAYRVNADRTNLDALPTTPGLALGTIHVGNGTTRTIPDAGTLGAGRIVIDADQLILDSAAQLTLVGDPSTVDVVVRVRGPLAKLRLGSTARIDLVGLTPEQVIFLVDGRASLRGDAVLAGTVFATDGVRLHRASRIDGAVLSGVKISLSADAQVNARPFAGW